MFNKLLEGVFASLVTMSRPAKMGLMLAVDAALLFFAAWAAYTLRFGYLFKPNAYQTLLMLAAPVLGLPVFMGLGLYRSVIRYVGEQALFLVVKGMSLSALMWAVLAFMAQVTGAEGLPRSVPWLYWLVGMFLVGGARFAARWALWSPIRRRFSGKQVLIYDAGVAGRQLAASLRCGRDLFPAGFLDDDPALQGKDVDGLRVYAPDELPKLIKRFEVGDVIVTQQSRSLSRFRQKLDFLERFPVRARVLPSVTSLADGQYLVKMVREVDIGDLLGRDMVEGDPDLLGRCVTGKSVLVTGAGGSIGSELCRQIAGLGPGRLVLLEANEHALYQIERALCGLAASVVPVLGSVKDQALLKQLLEVHGVQTIYHAAAHKHVPLVECNAVEGACNNVLGTLALARAAFDAGTETFVLISTDKAVRPCNVMGATKRWAELVVQDFARRVRAEGGRQRFCAVRFGNVLGSSGSVIPLFREQIARGGPLTVTHPEVTRYFMSIHEAVELVIQAGSMARGGEIFLLDMGEPVKILDLARKMIRLAGYAERSEENPGGEVEIVFTGLRPGEKLYEELLIADGNAKGTPHPKIMQASEPCPVHEQLEALMSELLAAIEARDAAAVREVLMKAAA